MNYGYTDNTFKYHGVRATSARDNNVEEFSSFIKYQNAQSNHCYVSLGGEMLDLLATILGGGIAGAGVAGILTKMLLDHRLERSQRSFQHDLDKEKQEIRTQLEVFAAAQKIRPISFEQKSIEALEIAYAAVAKTSLPRHRFRKKPTTNKFTGSAEEQDAGRYFHLFSENFQAFSRAFDSVSQAFQQVEDHAIYLAPELEQRVLATLRNIDTFYRRRHAALNIEHEKAKEAFDDKVLPSEFSYLSFLDFHSEMIQEWMRQTADIREELKVLVRTQLRAGGL